MLVHSAKARQTYAALGVGFVCIVIGLPLWWKTTEVYRVQLPYQDMDQLKDVMVGYSKIFLVLLFHVFGDAKFTPSILDAL